jgi:hypothetical protein
MADPSTDTADRQHSANLGHKARRSRSAADVGRHGELKSGTVGLPRTHSQSTAVRFDDRTADRQPKPQTARLGRVEGLAQVLEHRWRQTRPRVAHRHEHTVRSRLLCGQVQFSRSLAQVTHGLNGIDYQVQEQPCQRIGGRDRRSRLYRLVLWLHGDRRRVVPDVAIVAMERSGGGLPLLSDNPGGADLCHAKGRIGCYRDGRAG